MSAKFVGILLVVGSLVGGLIWLRRHSAPQVSQDSSPTSLASAGPSAPRREELSSNLPTARRGTGRAERAPVDGKYKDLFAQVDNLIRNGQAQEAYRLLEGVLKEDPRNERALEEMGMLHLTELQDSEKASAFFKMALAVNPNNELAVMELVGISLAPERAAAMADYLKGLYDANPGSPVLADGLGELYLSQGRFSDAVTYLERASQDPKNAEFAYTRLASVYEQMGEPDKAADFYKRAIGHQAVELDKRRADGQSTELLEADLARSQLDLAHLLLRERRCEEAQELVVRARRRLGNDWEVQALLDQVRQCGNG